MQQNLKKNKLWLQKELESKSRYFRFSYGEKKSIFTQTYHSKLTEVPETPVSAHYHLNSKRVK